MKSYYYSAFIHTNEGLAIFFPDFPEISSQANTVSEAMDMATDALNICVEEYAKERKNMPKPSNLETSQEKIAILLRDLDFTPQEKIMYQLISAPSPEMTPIRINVSFAKNILDVIDKKAEGLGMTRSGFLAKAAQAYRGHEVR